MTTRPGSEPASEEFRARRRAREAALQMLYHCEVGRASADEAIAAHGEIEQATRQLDQDVEQESAKLDKENEQIYERGKKRGHDR